jgi:hypothetical protein
MAARTEPRAVRAIYQRAKKALEIYLTGGATVTIPIKLIPSLRRAVPSDIRSVRVLGRGGGLHWESLDVDLSVPALVSSALRKAPSEQTREDR